MSRRLKAAIRNSGITFSYFFMQDPTRSFVQQGMNPSASSFSSQPGSLQKEAKSLSLLLDGVDQGEPHWTKEDLHAILRHQLQAPLQVDLGALLPGGAGKLEQLASARGLLLKSFRDLLTHPHPPAELLAMTKEFAKRNLIGPERTLPGDVARVMYFSSIGISIWKTGKNISQLPREKIRTGLAWCLGCGWLEPDIQNLLQEALDHLKEGESA